MNAHSQLRTFLTHQLLVVVAVASVHGLIAAQGPSSAQASDAKEDLAHARGLGRTFVRIDKEVRPSIVTVRCYVKGAGQMNPEDFTEDGGGWGESAFNDVYPGMRLITAGSGFIVDAEKGEILTCLNTIQKTDGTPVDLIDIELNDGTRIIGEPIGAEPTVNLAILRCAVFTSDARPKLKAISFGDSDAMVPGQWAFALGDPAGPERFFTAGNFVTRPSRDCYQELLSAFYIQAAMVVHPQAYGGPLVNLDGEVVGMTSPREPKPGVEGAAPRFGLEFALPSKILKGLYTSIRKAGSFRSPWLGFGVMSRAEVAAKLGAEKFTQLLKPRNGILIENVFKPSPAHAVGIQPNDFLVSFNGNAVFTPVDFQRYLYLTGIGGKVQLKLFRDGDMITKDLVIKLRPKNAIPR